MSAKNPVVTVKVHPGTSWQGLYVDGVLVADAWGEVKSIDPIHHDGYPDTILVAIGRKDETVAFYHVNALATAKIEREVKPSCQN